MTDLEIAQVCHETNRAYCEVLGDDSQLPWNEAPDWQRKSAVTGVEFHRGNPGAGPAHSHESWLKEKKADGWKYGAEKDLDKKEHPCCVPYEELPEYQKLKDAFFIAIVNAALGRSI
jgi:hypothetical protein